MKNLIGYDMKKMMGYIRRRLFCMFPKSPSLRKLSKNQFCIVLYGQWTLFFAMEKVSVTLQTWIRVGDIGVLLGLPNSYKEGIDEKSRCMAEPYKTKALKKS